MNDIKPKKIKIFTKNLVVFFLLLFSVLGYSQKVTVSGNDLSRAGKEIILYSWSDEITFLKDTIATCKIHKNGDFNCAFQLNETCPVFVLLEDRSAEFFAEPGTNYKIKIPTFKEPKAGKFLNPFQEEETIYLDLLQTDKTELNNMIRRFELMYNDYVSSRFNEIYKFAKHSGVDTVIKILDTTFSYQGNQYFNEYKRYKIGMLRYFAYIRNDKYLTKEYFRNQPLLYDNPAYMSLFCQTYDNYFTYYAKTSEGRDLSMNISEQKSYQQLKKTLSKNIALDDENFKELVILKGLHDAFYSGNYKSDVLLQTLDSTILQLANPSHKKIALNIKKKITAPEKLKALKTLEFFDIDSTKHTFEQFSGKYIYVGFCNTLSFSCKEEFELAKKLPEKKEKAFEMVTIFLDDQIKTVKEYIKTNNIKWPIFLADHKLAALKELNVKVFPTYYLIGPDGNIVRSNTKTLKEGFEEFFARTFGKDQQ